jgi:hypothetical protein
LMPFIMGFQGPPKAEPLNHTPIPHVNSLPSKLRLILGFGVLAEEPRGATIGPMSESRSCLPSKAFGC